jgi:carotenoid 1,2-hydratase
VGGYAWWYVEVHDVAEGRYGLTLILFAGSVFSPDYAARRRAGEPVCGLDVPAVNFALYERTRGPYPTTQRAWVMNEYPRQALQLADGSIRIADSALTFAPGGGVTIALDEDTTRFFGRRGPRVRGRITIAPPPPGPGPLRLGENRRGEAHCWQPLAARAAATVELQLGSTAIAYPGLAYCDHNYGSGRLEDTFAHWGWAHGFPTPSPAGAPPDEGALIVYSATDLGGQSRQLSVRYRDSQHPPEVLSADLPDEPVPTERDLRWLRVPQKFSAGPYTCQRAPGGTLEDTPFYARFAARLFPTAPGGPEFLGVGEYLDLGRFRRRSLQHLLRYKTRRIGDRSP